MKNNRIISVILLLLAGIFTVEAQSSGMNLDSYSWYHVAQRMPKEWYGTAQARAIADTVIKYQCANGGWPKNSGFHKQVKYEEMERIRQTGIGATIDNQATTMEMRYLARVHAVCGDEALRAAFLRGLDFLLEAQYDNGGWPQFYPPRKGRSVSYSAHITFNDDAMVNVMRLLAEIARGDAIFASLQLDEACRARTQTAFDRGVEAILKCQIVVDGEPTVWCAQHDERTMAPVGARSFELASFSGFESSRIVQLLMDIPNPSPEVIQAVKGAIRWFETHGIEGISVKRGFNEAGVRDCVVTPQEGAPTQWARFYDLETGKPFFCDRDGVKRASLDEVGQERRGGYSWYTTDPQRILDAYPGWLSRVQQGLAEQ